MDKSYLKTEATYCLHTQCQKDRTKQLMMTHMVSNMAQLDKY